MGLVRNDTHVNIFLQDNCEWARKSNNIIGKVKREKKIFLTGRNRLSMVLNRCLSAIVSAQVATCSCDEITTQKL